MSDGDYFDEARRWADKFHGGGLSDEDIVKRFALYGFETRCAALHQMETMADKGELTSEADIRKAANRMKIRRELNSIHHKLRLAGK